MKRNHEITKEHENHENDHNLAAAGRRCDYALEALNKQLGLKLEQQKRTIPVRVIDHAEEKPVED